MTSLVKLGITALRNIDSLSIHAAPRINILFGENGSGKTSVLEGAYLLGIGRSFRSTQMRPLIQLGRDECTVFGELDNGTTLGVTKSGRSAQLIRINGRKAENTAELARTLPIQLLNSDTFSLLEGGPGVRRRFLDWGVFHVEPQFFQNWRHVQRALQNRNSLLKRGRPPAEIEPWTRELARYGEEVDRARGNYVERLLPVLEEVLPKLFPLDGLSLSYERGWEEDIGLLAILQQSLERDLRYGHTVAGPQRSELKIKIHNQDAAEILSRGQQKLLVSSLKLAQGQLLEREAGRKCLYLVDDLPAELDRENRGLLCRYLEQMDCQVFITCVEREALDGCWERGDGHGLFHVKHGKILAC